MRKDTVSNDNETDEVNNGDDCPWIADSSPRFDTVVHDRIPIFTSQYLK